MTRHTALASSSHLQLSDLAFLALARAPLLACRLRLRVSTNAATAASAAMCVGAAVAGFLLLSRGQHS
jgi:hypothetical protein